MSEEISPTVEAPQIAKPRLSNLPKVVLVAVLGFGLLTASAYIGYWYSTESAKLKWVGTP